jgi:hypothetical protein
MALNITLRVWLPHDSAVRVSWLLPSIEAALILLLLLDNPGRLAKHTQRVHQVAVAFVVLLVVAALWATGLLIYDLIQGTGVTNSPSELLASGGLVWLGNNLAFALLSWLIDSDGPIARSRQSMPVDFAFTQHMTGARTARLATGLPRLPPPRLHECDRVQPDRRHAPDPPREVHDDRAVDGRARPLRADRGKSGKRLHVTPGLRASRPPRGGR